MLMGMETAYEFRQTEIDALRAAATALTARALDLIAQARILERQQQQRRAAYPALHLLDRDR